MVNTSTIFFFFMIFSCFASSMEARKLLRVQEMEKKMVPSEEEAEAATATATVTAAAVDARLYLNALPKGKVLASTPSDKGHEQIIDEKLIAHHLVAVDRILRSVPSPGVGH